MTGQKSLISRLTQRLRPQQLQQYAARVCEKLALGLALVALAGCATPTGKLVAFADQQQFIRYDINANSYRHLVLQNRPISRSAANTLHVYLEGDGSPWRYRVLRMRDPTPRQPLMLRLMSLDDQAAVYLGRPCYNGTFAESGCNDDLWTSARYSEAVVASMTGALQRLIAEAGAKEVRLFGHSGGGALALLIAERLPSVVHVVTLAGNLDTDAWVAHHRYSPLYGSLNPATRSPLRPSVVQWHLLGGKDTVIPPQLVRTFVQAQKNAFGVELGSFNHGCCWQSIWPAVLQGLNRNDIQRIPGVRFKYPAPATR